MKQRKRLQQSRLSSSSNRHKATTNFRHRERQTSDVRQSQREICDVDLDKKEEERESCAQFIGCG